MSGPTPFHIFTAIHKEKKSQKEKGAGYGQISTLRSSPRGHFYRAPEGDISKEL